MLLPEGRHDLAGSQPIPKPAGSICWEIVPEPEGWPEGPVIAAVETNGGWQYAVVLVDSASGNLVLQDSEDMWCWDADDVSYIARVNDPD